MTASNQIQGLLVHGLGINGNSGNPMVPQHLQFFLSYAVRPSGFHGKLQGVRCVKQVFQLT